jgi:sporulation protein YlmC with PRC-barrel domain
MNRGCQHPWYRRKTMKKGIAVVTLLAVFGLFLSIGAMAQPAPGPGTTREPAVTRPATPGTIPSTAMGEVYASKLIGANVKNPEGETVGKIDELVIDPQDARIKAAVVSVGGVLGLGAKSVAIPWNQVTMGTGTDRDSVVVAMGKEQLEKAPAWQKADR